MALLLRHFLDKILWPLKPKFELLFAEQINSGQPLYRSVWEPLTQDGIAELRNAGSALGSGRRCCTVDDACNSRTTHCPQSSSVGEA